MRAAIVAAALAAFAGAPAMATTAPPATVNYANAAAWVCRPGLESRCTTGLDAAVVNADGSRTLQPFSPAANPAIDCFYVYPTASNESTDYSDMTLTPEVQAVVHDQVGRLTSRCRVFAPIYRQLTSIGLKHALAADPTGATLNWNGPYADVLAAWQAYIARDNGGRGVVLIGHSQGAILLQRLIAAQIDVHPVQKQLVAAFLAGDPALPTPKGARTGGVFKSVPLCSASAQIGCAYVWGDYLDTDTATPRKFGVDPGGALTAGCVDPAAPAGGSGGLKPYMHKASFAPASDPPWVEALGQLTVICKDDAHNNVARVTILPTRFHDTLQASLSPYSQHLGWGLHPVDVLLTQGNILDRLDAEIATWAARPAH